MSQDRIEEFRNVKMVPTLYFCGDSMYTNCSMKKSQSGFAHFLLLLIIVLIVVGASGYFVIKRSGFESTEGMARWQSQCEGQGPVALTHTPMDLENVVSISPMGTTAGPHVTPIDHLYFYPTFESAPDAYPVYAMADGYIVDVSRRQHNGSEEFRLIFQHSCTFFTYVDLVRSLSQDVKNAFPELEKGDYANGHYFVSAGQEIGRIGGQSLDTAVYNTEVTLTGFISPELYDYEFWKIHTDDFFAHFSQDNREAMLTKNFRKAEPRSGKIDYDQPGKLIGNWFVEDTNGYAGSNEYTGNEHNNPDTGYFTTHLSFLPNAYQPDQLIVSLGNYNNQAKQFSVKGNAPDFTMVSNATGPVKYELIDQKFYNSDDPIQAEINARDDVVRATLLVQVLDGEKLKYELFVGKPAKEILGFTDSAIMYER